MTFDQRIVQIAKFLAAVIVFMGIIMPAQIIWFLLFPFAKMIAAKQSDRTGVKVVLSAMLPIEWYMPLAVKFCGGTM